MRKIFVSLSFVILFLSGCTYSIHQIPLSDFRPYADRNSGKPIESHAKQFVVLGFADETRYVDDAYRQLQGKCVGGTVTGIASKFYSEHGFFSWTNHLVMQGMCVQN